MSAIKVLAPVFVVSFPEQLETGKLYVSMEFASVAHLCACGCGSEVVTPLSPTDWRLSFDGVAVTLEPSIGNWRLPCRSHYVIRRNRIAWASDMSDDHIEFGRQRDRLAKQRYHQRSNVPPEPSAGTAAGSGSNPQLASTSTDTKRIQHSKAFWHTYAGGWGGRVDRDDSQLLITPMCGRAQSVIVKQSHERAKGE